MNLLGALDYENSKQIFKLLKEMATIEKKTVIIVTHDEESAFEFADMIVSISPDGDSLKEVRQNG